MNGTTKVGVVVCRNIVRKQLNPVVTIPIGDQICPEEVSCSNDDWRSIEIDTRLAES